MVDKDFMAAKQDHRRDDSPPRRELSLISIKSTCIDLNCAIEEIQSPKHEHFSIRGYVSETRKTNMKACLPFGGDVMNLPPMHVPKFRWWQCSDCVPGDSDQTSDAAAAVGEKSLKNIAENEPEKASSDIDAFSSLPPKWKRKGPRSYVKKVNKNASPRKRKDKEEEMARVDKKLKGPVIEISDSDSEKENIMPRRTYTKKRTVRTTTSSGGVGSSALKSIGKKKVETNIEKVESSKRYTGIPDLNEPFVERDDDINNTSDDIPMDIVELLAKFTSHAAASISTRKKVTFDLGPPSSAKLDAKDKGKSVQTSVVRHGRMPVGPMISRANGKRSFPQGRMPPLMGSSRAAVDLSAAQTSRSNVVLNLEVCTVNRNPADFSIPDDDRNKYMITEKDLVRKKRYVAPSRGGKIRQRYRG